MPAPLPLLLLLLLRASELASRRRQAGMQARQWDARREQTREFEAERDARVERDSSTIRARGLEDIDSSGGFADWDDVEMRY